MNFTAFCLMTLLSTAWSGPSMAAAASPQPDVSNLVKRNIATAGSEESIRKIHTLSFRVRQKIYYASHDGRLKIVSGGDPIVTEVIIAGADGARRNCYNRKTEFQGLIKTTYRILADLHGGMFTLSNFADRLGYQGIRRYGPAEYHRLSTKADDLDVDFLLDKTSLVLKRMELSGFSRERGHYKVGYDFGPLRDFDGIRIPESWFTSQVGSRGVRHEISDVRINPPLEENFFEDMTINAGLVETEVGRVDGHVLLVNTRQPRRIFLSTNWTRECMHQAGFESGEKLILEVADREIEVTFHATPPPDDATRPGARLVFPNRRDENYLIHIYGNEDMELIEQLQPLLPVRLRRKK